MLFLTAHGRAETPAPGLLGAEALFNRFESLQKESSGEVATEVHPTLADYLARRDALLAPDPRRTAEQAAAAWLDLAGVYWVLPRSGARDSAPYRFTGNLQPASFRGLVAALPSPESWSIIGERLETVPPNEQSQDMARRQVLRALAAFLNADADRFESSLAALSAMKDASRTSRYYDRDLDNELDTLRRMLSRKEPDPLARQEAELKAWRADPDSDREFVLSHFVALVGPEKTADLVRKALTAPGLRLKVADPGTLRLVQKIVLECLPDLPSPQWGLVDDSDPGFELFQKLSARFARPSPKDPADAGEPPPESTSKPALIGAWSDESFVSDYRNARDQYLAHLLGHGRIDEALEIVLPLTEDEVESYSLKHFYRQQSGAPGATRMDFLGRWIETKPDLKLWDAYVDAAIVAGRASEALLWLESQAKRSERTAEQRFRIGLAMAKLHLAMDQAEQAVLLWRDLVRADTRNEMPGVRKTIEELKVNLIHLWAGTALAVGNTGWFDEADALLARTQLSLDSFGSTFEAMYWSGDDHILKGLLEQGRFVEAESRVWSELTNSLAGPDGSQLGEVDVQMALIGIYDRADRPDQVLAALERVPWWGGATNLASLDSEAWVPAAKALHATGRTGEAWTILRQSLAVNPGDDQAYAVLIQYPPEQVLPFLDQLYARDLFEERPLIWKATILLRQGKLDEAEATVRLALKIDPTDGEQPPGDRVRSYAVLADILAAKGKAEDAEFFRNVVKSVRIAEEGDRLAGVGLTARSLQRYAEAETLFADAYCVQWRLAERLRETGRMAEAQKHYQVAFERMPEQFGQMASLCFGCMGVFRSPASRGAAETVLTRLAAQPPVRPAVYYLLGQLREAQGRYDEAYAEYQKAVDLDPGYLDVWTKIYCLRDEISRSSGEWSALEIRLLRMDPLNRHVGLRLEKLGDLKGFWAARTEALPLELPWVHDLLPLTANLAARAGGKDYSSKEYRWKSPHEQARLPPPGEVIAQHNLVRWLDEIQSSLGLAQPEDESPLLVE